jgi:putative peptide zinc metalloprotease protein
MFRGSQWYVLHDPFTDKYFRLRPNAYEFVARLSSSKTVEEVWHLLLENAPDKAPGQSEIIDLLAQLYHANLIHYELTPNSSSLFDRYKKRKQKLVKMNLLNIMFARIPLFDPDNLLKYLQPLIRFLISPVGLIVWLGVIGIGIKTAIDNFGTLKVQSEGILASSNLFLLYMSVVVIKVIHELGHAFAVRRFGGEVHAMGIMLMVMAPLPYTDATASWSFRNKWQRIFVGAAGMMFELVIAAVAVIVWASTGDGVLHSIAYNMVFTASVTTLLFNINPLLRYDGYYILCDLLGIPNLQQQANQQITYLTEQYAFGKKDSVSPSSNTKEATFFSIYAVTSFFYRIIVFSGILLFISKKMLLLAVVMGIFLVTSWAIVPIFKFIKYLSTSSGLTRVRARAIRVTIITFVMLFVVLNYIPFPYCFKAPGVLKASEYIKVVNSTTAKVVSLGLRSGSKVRKNDTLLVLDNKEIRELKTGTEAALREAHFEYTKALESSQADLEPIEKKISVYTERLQYLEKQIDGLVVKADIDGIWVAPDVDDFNGRWMPRGTPIGQIINTNSFYFASVIPQKDISELFAQNVANAVVQIRGHSDKKLKVSSFNTIPMEQSELPSPALGFSGGGDIEVLPGDSSGVKTTEPFYEVRAVVDQVKDVILLQGRSGKVKFSLGYKPLLWQGWRKIRQLIQKHYKI